MDYRSVFRAESAREFCLPTSVTEDNWKSRKSFMDNLTTVIKESPISEAPKDFHIQIEPYLNNILDSAVCERTTLSNSACQLLAVLPEVLERDLHPHLDRLLPTLLKLCANTKQVTVKQAASAVTSIIKHATYNPRLLWHVCQVFEDKAAGPKIHATEWLQTIMKEYHKSIDLSKENRLLSRAITLALNDADSTVRTKSRATYWTYDKIDHDTAEEIMEKLDTHKRTALQNDPHNPDKKAGAVKKEPPRPRSALADVRKEQAKKKRAEEEAQQQRRALNTSTASHESIEIHEPRKDKAKKEERSHLHKATSTDRTDESRQATNKSHNITNNATSHKKTLSQDHEVVTKPSASSRLLSAPVRRPRINVTPMVQQRPNSRTGQVVQSVQQTPSTESSQSNQSMHEHILPTNLATAHRAQSAVRPVSSSGLTKKLAEPYNPLPEPHEIVMQSPPTSLYKASGKENRMVSPVKSVTSAEKPSTTITNPIYIHNQKGPLGPVSPFKIPVGHMKPAGWGRNLEYQGLREGDHTRLEKPPAKYVLQEQNLPDFTSLENGLTKDEKRYSQKAIDDPQTKLLPPPGPDYPETARPQIPEDELGSKQGQHDLKVAQRFLARTLQKLQQGDMLDSLTLRKLKLLAEQYPGTLIEDKDTFVVLFAVLCFALGSPAHLRKDGKFDYNRALIVQMMTPFFRDYKPWASQLYHLWIESMIYYRCTLTLDAYDRQVEYINASVITVVRAHPDPLKLIASVTSAIEEGEKILLKVVAMKEQAQEDTLALKEMGEDGVEPELSTSVATFASWNDYDPRSEIKKIGAYIADAMADHNPYSGKDKATYVTDYMKRALNQYNLATYEHDRPYPRALPQLFDYSLWVLDGCLERAIGKGFELSKEEQKKLCKLAVHCIRSYDYMVKMATVRFVKHLYQIMCPKGAEDEEKFWEHFVGVEEGITNLMHYYIENSTRVD